MFLKFTCSAALLLGGAAAFAQPTITSANIPTPGLTSTSSSNSAYIPGAAGASQIWDFSAQTFSTGSSTGIYSACNASSNCASYPGSNLVELFVDDTSYLKVTNVALSNAGNSSNGYSSVYSDPEDLMHYPFTYGNTFIDTWAKVITSSGATEFQTGGVDSVTADGWGTLKTPAGIFTNVLRIRRIVNYTDSFKVNGSSTASVSTFRGVNYEWRDALHKGVLYITSSYVATDSGGTSQTYTYSKYYEAQPSGVPGIGSGLADWMVTPNPVIGDARVIITATEAANAEIALTDMTGRSAQHIAPIRLAAGDNRCTIPMSGLAPGMYILRMTINGQTDVKKIVVAD